MMRSVALKHRWGRWRRRICKPEIEQCLKDMLQTFRSEFTFHKYNWGFPWFSTEARRGRGLTQWLESGGNQKYKAFCTWYISQHRLSRSSHYVGHEMRTPPSNEKQFCSRLKHNWQPFKTERIMHNRNISPSYSDLNIRADEFYATQVVLSISLYPTPRSLRILSKSSEILPFHGLCYYHDDQS